MKQYILENELAILKTPAWPYILQGTTMNVEAKAFLADFYAQAPP